MGNCCGSLKVNTARKTSLRSYRVAPEENGGVPRILAPELAKGEESQGVVDDEFSGEFDDRSVSSWELSKPLDVYPKQNSDSMRCESGSQEPGNDVNSLRQRYPASRTASEIHVRRSQKIPKRRPNSLNVSKRDINELQVPNGHNETFWIPGSLARHMGYNTGTSAYSNGSTPCITLNGTEFSNGSESGSLMIPMPSPPPPPASKSSPQRRVGVMYDLYDHPRVLLDSFRSSSAGNKGHHNSLPSERREPERGHKAGFNGPSSLQCQVTSSASPPDPENKSAERKHSGVVHWVVHGANSTNYNTNNNNNNNGCDSQHSSSLEQQSFPPPQSFPHLPDLQLNSPDHDLGSGQPNQGAEDSLDLEDDYVELSSLPNSSLETPSDHEDTLSIYKVHTTNADDSNLVIMRKITVTSRRSVDYSDLEAAGGDGSDTASIVPVENPSSLERRFTSPRDFVTPRSYTPGTTSPPAIKPVSPAIKQPVIKPVLPVMKIDDDISAASANRDTGTVEPNRLRVGGNSTEEEHKRASLHLYVDEIEEDDHEEQRGLDQCNNKENVPESTEITRI